MTQQTTPTMIGDIATLIRAIGSLLWPVVAGYVVVRNEKQIRSLLERLRKGKILGQEIELEGSLKELKRQVSAVEDETPSAPPSPSSEIGSVSDTKATGGSPRSTEPHPDIKASNFSRADDPLVVEVLETAAKSPTVALMQLASGIEKIANTIWSDLDDGSKPIRPSVRRLIDGLSHVLPRSVPSALRTFWDVRNRIVHGRDADEHETLSALDSGISLYRSLVSFSRSYAVVTRSEIPVYADAAGQIPANDCTAVELEFRPNGDRVVWPTSKKGYVPQMVVRRDFDLSRVFHDIWIKDPVTGNMTKAFDSAADFIGEPISVKLGS